VDLDFGKFEGNSVHLLSNFPIFPLPGAARQFIFTETSSADTELHLFVGLRVLRSAAAGSEPYNCAELRDNSVLAAQTLLTAASDEPSPPDGQMGRRTGRQ
jgi:hypothetical protein